jgi:hypothetical protein
MKLGAHFWAYMDIYLEPYIFFIRLASSKIESARPSWDALKAVFTLPFR